MDSSSSNVFESSGESLYEINFISPIFLQVKNYNSSLPLVLNFWDFPFRVHMATEEKLTFCKSLIWSKYWEACWNICSQLVGSLTAYNLLNQPSVRRSSFQRLRLFCIVVFTLYSVLSVAVVVEFKTNRWWTWKPFLSSSYFYAHFTQLFSLHSPKFLRFKKRDVFLLYRAGFYFLRNSTPNLNVSANDSWFLLSRVRFFLLFSNAFKCPLLYRKSQPLPNSCSVSI